MPSYLALKHLHTTAVYLTIALFTLRGVWMLMDSPWLKRRWVRITPHIIDTLLLASAIGMIVMIGQYPFYNSAWLTAKTLGLIVYIVLGTIALKRGKTKPIRAVAFVASLGVALYILAVAFSKDPLMGLA